MLTVLSGGIGGGLGLGLAWLGYELVGGRAGWETFWWAWAVLCLPSLWWAWSTGLVGWRRPPRSQFLEGN